MRSIRSGTVLLLLVLGAAAPLYSQSPAPSRLASDPAPAARGSRAGTVSGRVLDGRTLQPISGAQVMVVGTAIGTLSNPDGRYILVNVPDGPATVRVQMIGFGVLENPVTVAAGATASADFQLQQEALSLDAVIVTGAAGQARVREVGNAIAQVNLEETITPMSAGVETLLSGAAAGVRVTASGGQVGSGAQIRLRGNVSSALSNQPLIYIDGVRMQSDAYDDVAPMNLGNQYGTFATPTPLQDINPADIARIEIIKGAAATTLYGTEAAAGVIQIFTKRGGTGAPSFDVAIEQGVATKNFDGTARTLRGTPVSSFPQSVSAAGGSYRYGYLDPWMRNAHRQQYTASVRGGTPDVSYFVSTGFQSNEDLFVSGFEEATSIRGNLGLRLHSTLNVDWNTSYNAREIKNVGCGDNFYGLCARRAYGIIHHAKAQLDSLAHDPDYRTQIDRFTTGVTVRHQPLAGLSNRFTVGYDRADNVGQITIPYGFTRRPGGLASLTDGLLEIKSIDLVSTYALELPRGLAVDLSAGLQRVEQSSRQVSGFTERFPGPGEVTLSSGAVSQAREEVERVITGGLFGQALFKIADRYFVTAGARVDGNSAFGQDFGWQVYPKLSGSYVISDEPFWPAGAGSVKLRAAWGAAGRAPGAFDAVRTWNPVPWGDEISFNPRNLGNAELGPERTVETELGFDASFLDDRLTADFTWYRGVTTDALLSVGTAHSNGPWGSQLTNIGKLENGGVELALGVTPVRRPSLVWELGLDVATNRSEVLDMGGVNETATIAVGHPVGSVRGTRILNPDEVAAPRLEKLHRFGPSQPTLIVAPSTTLGLPGGIELSVRGEYQGGHWINDSATQWAMAEGNQEQPVCFDAYALLAEGRGDELTAMERVWCSPADFDSNAFKYPADFFKLREVSVSVPVAAWVPGARSASLTLSGQNLWRWVNEDFLAYDPEQAGGFGGLGGLVSSLWQKPANPKVFTAALRVGF